MIVQRQVRLLRLLIGVAQPVTRYQCSLVCARPPNGDYYVHMFGFYTPCPIVTYLYNHQILGLFGYSL